MDGYLGSKQTGEDPAIYLPNFDRCCRRSRSLAFTSSRTRFRQQSTKNGGRYPAKLRNKICSRERLALLEQRDCGFSEQGDRSMLSFETVVLVILGVVAGAELLNVFMLGRLQGSVSPVLAPVVKGRTS